MRPHPKHGKVWRKHGRMYTTSQAPHKKLRRDQSQWWMTPNPASVDEFELFGECRELDQADQLIAMARRLGYELYPWQEDIVRYMF